MEDNINKDNSDNDFIFNKDNKYTLDAINNIEINREAAADMSAS